MNKIYIFISFFVFIVTAINAQKIYYVDPVPIENYNPQGCGTSVDAACNTINDAIYTFLNATSPTNTTTQPFVVNLLQGAYFSNQSAPGVNDTISVYGLNITIQSYGYAADSNNSAPIVLNGTYLSKITLFKVNGNTSSTTSLTFNNIQFDSFYNSILYANSLDGPFSLYLNNCSITNMPSASTGLIYTNAYYQRSSIFLTNSIVKNNNGSVIFSITRANFDITNSTIGSNTGVYLLTLQTCTVNVVNSVISNNTMSSNYTLSPLFDIQNTVFNMINSSANANIGGSYVFSFKASTLSLSNCSFNMNNYPTGSYYGVLYLTSSYTTIKSSVFNYNYAISGGAIYNQNGGLTIYNSTFYNNQARYGSQITHLGNTLSIYDSLVVQNQSLTLLPQSLLSISSANVYIKNTQIQATSTIGTTFSVINCNSAIVSFTQSFISTFSSYSNLTCSSCTTINDGESNNPLLQCPQSSSEQDSSSYHDHPYYPPIFRVIYLILISFFSILLFIGLIIILVCICKQRKERKHCYQEISNYDVVQKV
ncbi:hypothetical protein CYY_002553 [Polysphondylium violaceum]|uniref:Right handed beta helix domain-containing protein n=1 Tax=Polysphondylium violaceum TaxID=133409 RepID=A0A8J4PY95_9MYCE|nr:hypothetical protein CYY_002553 [Polysphondylium violaceum]